MGIRVHRSMRLTQPTTRLEMGATALAARMTQAERSQMRGGSMDVLDLKEELVRPGQVNVNSKVIKRLMLASGVFDQDRIDELFS